MNHNRLSRPRTDATFLNPPTPTASPDLVSSRRIDLSAKERQQIRETILSPAYTEFGFSVTSPHDDDTREPSIQRHGRSGSLASLSNSWSHSRSHSRSNSLSWFGSRHGSTTKLASFSESRTSLSSITPTDVGLVGNERLEPFEDHAGSASETGLSRRTSDTSRSSSSSLTRRRSLLQTPGVATRPPPAEGRRQTWNSWKTPQLDPNEEAKWRATPRRTSHPYGLAAFHIAEESYSPSTPRAQTPGEMDYSHLGSLRLGSLVVTNGAPSPAASTKTPKPRTRCTEADDYFTTAGAGSSPLGRKGDGRQEHTKNQSYIVPSIKSSSGTALTFNDKLVLLKTRHDQSGSVSENLLSNTQPGMKSSETSLGGQKDANTPAQDADLLASSYRAEISYSPFGRPSDGDDDAEPKLSQILVDRSMPVTEDPPRMFETTNIHEASAMTDPTSFKAYSKSFRRKPVGASISGTSQQTSSLAADSGYSSGGSPQAATSEQPKQPSTGKSARRPHSILKNGSVEKSGQLASPVVSNPSTPLFHTEQPPPSSALPHRPAPLRIPNRNAQSLASSPTFDTILSPQTPHPVAPRTSLDSTSSSNKRRLYRRRASQPELPVIQSCQPIPEGTIPQVPIDVRVQFARRLSHTPGMECLTHTYPTTEHILTEKPVSDPAPRKGPCQLIELEPERPFPHPNRQRSRSLFRKKSNAEDKEPETEVDIFSPGFVDLGTIEMMLGSSPYDAATLRPLKKANISPTRSRQTGNGLPRAQSMVNLEVETPDKLPRRRSRDQAALGREQGSVGHDSGRLKDVKVVHKSSPVQRRRSSFHNLKLEVGEATASKRRPPNSREDIPPVPRIDTSKLSVSGPRTAMPRVEGQAKAEGESSVVGVKSYEGGQALAHSIEASKGNGQGQLASSADWGAPLDAWSQRRKSIGEGLRMKNELRGARASQAHSRTMSPTTAREAENVASWDRYSGGLAYSYEGRAGGIGGSAGTRQQLDGNASRKSMHWRNQYRIISSK